MHKVATQHAPRKHELKETCMNSLSKYLIILLYTMTLGHSMITPQSFTVAMNGCMLGLSHVLLFQQPPEGQGGLEALREAWSWRKLLKFLPCGFCFAVTSALMSMGMGIGISGPLSVVIGKISLPICAIVSSLML